MIDFKELGQGGEIWELFARDFFMELGFSVVSTPDRGPDGGKDLIILETTEGKLNHYPFKWLVSCKNYATSNKAVGADEQDISDRCRSFMVDGFIGFYSTIVSSALNTKLNQLKEKGDIKDYKIFDNKLIENYIVQYGFSKIMLRYFPESYKKIRPLHKVFDKEVELKCDACGKNILSEIYNNNYQAICSFAFVIENGKTFYKEFYCACKGKELSINNLTI